MTANVQRRCFDRMDYLSCVLVGVFLRIVDGEVGWGVVMWEC